MPGYDVFFKEFNLTEEATQRIADAMDHIEPKRPSIPENAYEEGIAWLKENAYRLSVILQKLSNSKAYETSK